MGLSEETEAVAVLDSQTRARLPDSSFAYVDSRGQRRLPINDAAHVRNALARFEQTSFEDSAARERARQRLLRAAKKYNIVPLGFFDGQLRKERQQGEIQARATSVAMLPKGTVSFLFTDIEGSTRLTQRLGDRYAALLRDIRTLIRKAVSDAEGHEVDARADEFFGVFREPMRALDAALAIQRALRKRSSGKKLEVRVRIGIHTGRPTLTETGYVGIAVHTAARVCQAGHGGQILLSAVARDCVAETLAEGVALRGLGLFPLAGIPKPEALFQVEAADLVATFPPPRVAPD